MTEHATTPGHQTDGAAAAAALRARAANTRSRPRRRHPAQGARIAAVGIGATTLAGLVGIMGYTQPSSATPNPPNQIAVVTNDGGTTEGGSATAAISTRTSADSTTLTARPTVRQAPPTDQAPAASTSGSG